MPRYVKKSREDKRGKEIYIEGKITGRLVEGANKSLGGAARKLGQGEKKISGAVGKVSLI